MHLYSERAEYNRILKTREEIINMQLHTTYKKFESGVEALNYASENGVQKHKYVLENKIVTGRTGYASVFYYDKEEMTSHMEKNKGSTASFKGKCYSNWLYLDIDSKVSPEDMKRRVTPFLDKLNKHNIVYIMFFSGRNGIHLYIPMRYMKVLPGYESKAHLVCKIFSRIVAKEFPDMDSVIDTQPYAINTVLRMPFTTNNKSGKLKTLLEYKDGKFSRIGNSSDIFEQMKHVLWGDMTPDVEPIWQMTEEHVNIKPQPEIKFKTDFPAPYGDKVCVYNLIKAKLREGDHRHDAGLRLMSFWHKEKMYPSIYVWHMLQAWNLTLEDSMKESELKSIHKYIETMNYNLCKDAFMEQYCCKNNLCPYWNAKQNGIKASNALQTLDAIDEEDKDDVIKLNLNTIFPGINFELKPTRILYNIAAAKVGKTLIALTVALKSKIPTAIFSYEISRTAIMRTLAKMLKLDINCDMDRIKLIQETKHIFIIDEGRLPLQEAPNEVANIERENNIKIQLVIWDYLQIMPVRDINNPSRMIVDVNSALGVIGSILPDMVKKNKWMALIPAQPTKAVEGGGRAVLMPDSGRGGQVIKASGDGIITAWRPYKPVDPLANHDDADNVICIWLGENRHGPAGYIKSYDYDGNNRIIGGIYQGNVKQTKPIIPKET